eukprot:TRINITY_DN23885_c0_g1_i1.p1 TRINITY_DN23885_c0_g1~~TRINITY_DN23885_c0_g1_i1.p1  ORF type:complete len:111 (+),score=13.14 TRINITY_DN23885_c0_g1_i1:165-497(+)
MIIKKTNFFQTAESFFNDTESKLSFATNDKIYNQHQRKKLFYILKDQVRELSDRVKLEQQRNICPICKTREINCVYLECGHKLICYNCSSQFSECIKCKVKPTRLSLIHI